MRIIARFSSFPWIMDVRNYFKNKMLLRLFSVVLCLNKSKLVVPHGLKPLREQPCDQNSK